MEFGVADYYIIGEFIACWGSLLIIVTTLLSYAMYDERQRMFLIAAAATFFASFFNILSVRCIAHYSLQNAHLFTFITTLYFLFLLLFLLLCLLMPATWPFKIQNGKKSSFV
jgi:hypothetical protein